MKMKKQVISLKQAQYLKSAGLNRHAHYSWATCVNTSSKDYELNRNKAGFIVILADRKERDDLRERDYLRQLTFHRAYTAQELLDLLPTTIYKNHNKYDLHIVKMPYDALNSYEVLYLSETGLWTAKSYGDTLVIAVFSMLTLLLEQSMVSTSYLNLKPGEKHVRV